MDIIDKVFSLIGSDEHMKSLLIEIVNLDDETLSLVNNIIVDSPVRGYLVELFKFRPFFGLIKMYLNDPTMTRLTLTSMIDQG
jgi:hypothetical protein